MEKNQKIVGGVLIALAVILIIWSAYNYITQADIGVAPAVTPDCCCWESINNAWNINYLENIEGIKTCQELEGYYAQYGYAICSKILTQQAVTTCLNQQPPEAMGIV